MPAPSCARRATTPLVTWAPGAHARVFQPALLLILLAVLGHDARAQSVTLADPFPDLLLPPILELMDAGDGTNLLYFASKYGRVGVFENRADVSQWRLFLGIRSRVNTDGEGGLLGLAFDPDYADNGHFYVYYTTTQNGPFTSRVSRFTRVVTSPPAADPDSEVILLEVEQPFLNHNAGAIAFGPPEGPGGERYLYVALGDGGGNGDPGNNGQNPGTLLGSILRLDVHGGGGALDCGAGTGAATVPPGNPFVGVAGACDEIYAYGFRNPWRMRFDEAGDWSLWVGDVGQSRVEEIDVVEAGGNYGWDMYEGTLCFEGPCDPEGITFPVYEYGHTGGHISITGGFVYRGTAIPELFGKYVYGDLSGPVYALDVSGGAPVNEFLANLQDEGVCSGLYCLASFGKDAEGELYALANSRGVRKIVPASPLALEVTVDQPISIPAEGGAFSFHGQVENISSAPQAFQAWTDVLLPDGTPYGPLVGPLSASLSPGASQERTRTQGVPGQAPAGEYTYRVHVGPAVGTPWVTRSFTFTKAASTAAEALPEVGAAPSLGLAGVYPNPFRTHATVQLSEVGEGPVRVELYDALGRRVRILHDGLPPADGGVLLDRQDLPGGVYFVRLVGGGHAETRRVVLMQ